MPDQTSQTSDQAPLLNRGVTLWQCLAGLIGVMIALSSLGLNLYTNSLDRTVHTEERIRVLQYQSEQCVADRAALRVAIDTLTRNQETQNILVSDKLTRLETLMDQLLKRSK